MEPQLHPELAAHIEPFGANAKMLRHPLVVAVPYHGIDFEIEHLNALLERKKLMLMKSKEERDHHTTVFLHERPFRLQAFLNIHSQLNAQEYYRLLSAVWIDGEGQYINHGVWAHLLRFRPSESRHFMEDDEVEAHLKLPETLKVYRGTKLPDEYPRGISWTTDRKKAIWFANRFRRKDQPAYLYTLKVQRNDVFAYLTRRGESECLIMPQVANPHTVLELPNDKD